jgi:hypothetical protein
VKIAGRWRQVYRTVNQFGRVSRCWGPRGHDELAVEEPVTRRVAVAFDELALTI